MDIKLQKFIAETGYCSRRKAEDLIEEKRVKVNGKIAHIGMRVNKSDSVFIDKEKIEDKRNLIYIALNKPKGYLCTNRKELGQKNIFDLVETEERLFVVGRLDKNSRGLVLLTNDGDLAYNLTHPSKQHEKEYVVETSRELPIKAEGEMRKGVDIGEKRNARVKDIKRIGKNIYRIVLTEGKKRQLRRMFELFDCTVIDLKRTRIDKYKLSNLKQGDWQYIEK